MNMEVAETSGVVSDDASSPGTYGGEPSPRTGDDATIEGPVDARSSTSGGAATEGRHEEAARCSSRPDDADSPRASQTPLAFTIDFGNNKEVDTARYQNLFERYNARHRRNLSTSKVLRILSFSTYVSCISRYSNVYIKHC